MARPGGSPRSSWASRGDGPLATASPQDSTGYETTDDCTTPERSTRTSTFVLSDRGQVFAYSEEPPRAAFEMSIPSRVSLTLRAVAALLLVVGFYALALGIAFGLLGVIYFAVVVARQIEVKLVIGSAIGAGAILFSLIPEPDHFEPPGPRLRPEEHPRLFAVLEQLARAAGQRMPDDVYLTPDLNAWVASRGGVMGLGSRRVMVLGLPLLDVLDVDQLRAVLAHELGHYHGGDVMLGAWLYKTRAAIRRTIESLSDAQSILHLLFAGYGSLFLRITHAISRHQELQADAMAARLVGPQALVSGLEAVHGGALAYAVYREQDLVPVLRAGQRPPFLEGFRRFRAIDAHAEAMRDAVQHELRHAQTDRFDTHPALPERVAAIEALRLTAPSPTATPGPALALLVDPDGLEEPVLEHLLPATRRGRKLVAWEEVGAHVHAALLRDEAKRGARLVKGLTLGTIPADRAGLLHWAREALGHEVPKVEAELAPALEQDLLRFAIQVLATAILHRLAETGWRLETGPGEPLVVTRDGQRFDPAQRLYALAGGQLDVEAWRTELDRAGIAELPLHASSPREDARPTRTKRSPQSRARRRAGTSD